MNKDLNPLSDFTSYSTYHIILAFRYSEDAYAFNYNQIIGSCGTILKGGSGVGMVIANEVDDTNISLTSAVTTWSFFSPVNSRTSSYEGTLEITDRSGFYFTEIISRFTKELNMSMNHLTFAWVPVFVGKNNGKTEVIRANPMFFFVTNYSHGITATVGRTHYFNIVSAYNTHGLSPQFNTAVQLTVNNREANTINTIPTPTAASTGIVSTMEEDKNKLKARQDRLQKNKYMKTIGDFCSSLEACLNEQKNDHKLQLQKFMGLVRADFTNKIKIEGQRNPLPIDYKINVSDYYKDKKIDNLNLPFEQYEIDQGAFGLSSITFPINYNIHLAIADVMKMSKDIGRDHAKLPATTFKYTTATKRKSDGKYLIHTNVNEYISPYNGEVAEAPNTGPGKGLVDSNKIIEYTYQDISGNLREDTNVISITYTVVPTFGVTPRETVPDEPDTEAIFVEREPVTLRRGSTYADFFQNSFSGMNSILGLSSNNGLQNSQAATSISSFAIRQPIVYGVNVIGNPNLLSDINRNPNDVISNSSGNALIYKNTEYEPMYLKLKIYLAGDTLEPTSAAYHYDGYLHIYEITNIFTPGSFTQVIRCARTNERT